LAFQEKAPLVIRKGDCLKNLQELIKETGADTVYWTRRYEPKSIVQDSEIKTALRDSGVTVQSFQGQLLIEPWALMNKQGRPFQVFTPFFNACKILPVRAAFSKPKLNFVKASGLSVDDLDLLPRIHWDRNMMKHWTPGENGAKHRLQSFIKESLADYHESRDLPALEDGVSKLSPHLHFGEISPFQIWNAIISIPEGGVYLRQIYWREFAHYLLYHFPHMVNKAFKPVFDHFKWEKNPTALKKWQKGLTGYPIVDAGMRELWQTGWMHNRVRMIVGSFLVKDLLISWEEGAKWFMDTLFDADLANNTLGWQWVGGMGPDAAPYFRIFNPLLQGEKFDPDGEYVKKYVPELQHLPKKWIHRPYEAPEIELRSAGVTLGKTYPSPLVDHAKARLKALALYKGID
jgi:deoxyribodipyrimidine photo-lyase